MTYGIGQPLDGPEDVIYLLHPGRAPTSGTHGGRWSMVAGYGPAWATARP